MKRILTLLSQVLCPRALFDRPAAGRRRPTRRLALEPLEDRSLPSSYSVLNTADSGPNSLREAITQANANPSSGGPNVIPFHIPTSDPGYNSATGTWTIKPLTPLPAIIDPVVLDGYTQPGASRNTLASGTNAVLKIELDGEHIPFVPANGPVNGLVLEASNCTVTGLVINRFHDNGIVIINAVTGNKVQGNYLGTNVAGDARLPNGAAGMHIFQASNNTVGGTDPGDRNVISGNHGDGVFIVGFRLTPGVMEHPAQGNVVQNNYIGTNAQGKAALGNVSVGVDLIAADSNTVGGTTASARNVISGNLDGVQIIEGLNTNNNNAVSTSMNLVEGNYIGTDASGGAGATAPGMGNSAYGVYLSASGTIVGQEFVGGAAAGAGNVISGNGGHGVYLNGTSHCGVQGNYIGTDATGTLARPNLQDGVLIFYGNDNSVGGTAAGARNVISGNRWDGVAVTGSVSSLNVIQGNYVGTAADGGTALGNGSMGVDLSGGAANTVGGTAAGAGNVISGNGGSGLYLNGEGGDSVQGNDIGTDASGTAVRPNLAYGVLIMGGNHNSVGDTAAGARNIISGNGGHGVYLNGTVTCSVQGNYIGTDSSGSLARPNLQDGVLIMGGDDNSVGGTAAGAGNVISGNGWDGVAVAGGSSANVIQGNDIGTRADGTNPLGNGSLGVSISNSNGNAVGGTAAGAGNVISANASHGVQVAGNATGNAIRENAIFANGRLGINLAGGVENNKFGVTANHTGTVTSGPNLLQNFPVLTRALLGGIYTVIIGTLPSTPGKSYTVEFFASAVADPSGFGEGQTFLGSMVVTTDPVTGVASFTAKVRPCGTRTIITATATDAAGNTSEFSRAIRAT
jgi:titin